MCCQNFAMGSFVGVCVAWMAELPCRACRMEKWYNIRCRDGEWKTKMRENEIFGCIPHARGAYFDLNHEIH